MKVYIVIELDKKDVPRIIGVYSTRDKAEYMAMVTTEKNRYSKWVNIIEREVE